MKAYFDLNQQTYDWCVRVFDRAKNLLGVRIVMHHDARQLADGDIFLFNHFARAETFIPQYCIYKETGALCRSIAAAELFAGNDRFGNLLRDVGAVPNNHPALLSLLAIDILKGRKIIIFPEGGMVKDRQVIDDEGEYSIFSRSAGNRRKHHSGAARLAIGLQIFKQAVLNKFSHGKHRELEHWAEALDLPSAAVLVERARRPVTVVPANITFYPLRVEDNFLSRGADLLVGKLSPRAVEELIIEGNLFFKATDMDIRCGAPIRPADHWQWWERLSAGYIARGTPSLEAVFEHEYLLDNPVRKLAAKSLNTSIDSLRDRSMREIYRVVTVNMSHLAAWAIIVLLERGTREFSMARLAQVIYLAIKRLQPHSAVHLHRSLINPSTYRALLDGHSDNLREFLTAAASANLILIEGDSIRALDKLSLDHSFDRIRLENPIEVYANESEPVAEVVQAVRGAIAEIDSVDLIDHARHAFDDELRALDWDRRLYTKAKHQEINAQETATANPAPFLLLPGTPRRLGVLLVHGFLAAPGEMRPLGDKLVAAHYPVLGVRLKGHGTSPWDLRERSWRDWKQSIKKSYAILRAYCAEVVIVGFSTGGALTLSIAADSPADLAGIVAIAPPFKFRNRNMRYVPLVHGANQLVGWVSNHEGVVPFRPTDTEHPTINYRNMPIRGLYELTRMVAELKKSLKSVTCPVLVIQGTEDHVVDPHSAQMVYDKLGSADKTLQWVESKRHGIVFEDVGNTHALILEFLAKLDSRLVKRDEGMR
ncbi:MAG: alpha/beta fold hydrolase [Gammaproteobacteria bacterium]|nr:alpha/beta fold hydrolase [Gammaproteobacteria bacterium]